MRTALWVAAGSSLGGVARVLFAGGIITIFGDMFPYGMLAVNVAGSFLIGLLAALTATGGRLPLSHEARQFLMAGFCGGFTTFSFFSLQTMLLIENGESGKAAFYVAGTVFLSMGAVWLGFIIGRTWSRLPSPHN